MLQKGIFCAWNIRLPRKGRNISGKVSGLRNAAGSFLGGGEWGGSRYIVSEEEMRIERRKKKRGGGGRGAKEESQN